MISDNEIIKALESENTELMNRIFDLEAEKEALINGQLTLQKMYAEAIKEFAEEFENRCIASGVYPALIKNILKNLLKELTEGSNGE